VSEAASGGQEQSRADQIQRESALVEDGTLKLLEGLRCASAMMLRVHSPNRRVIKKPRFLMRGDRLTDLAELSVPFCAHKNGSGCLKTLAIRQTGPEIGEGVVPFCACAKSVRSP
jgi:hypothetical protein